jgi:hypothetical protein
MKNGSVFAVQDAPVSCYGVVEDGDGYRYPMVGPGWDELVCRDDVPEAGMTGWIVSPHLPGLTATQRGVAVAVLFSAGNSLSAKNVATIFDISVSSAYETIEAVRNVVPGLVRDAEGCWSVS